MKAVCRLRSLPKEERIYTMRFGPLKPVGLTDPRTGNRPYAVVQLRAENAEGSLYNLVGFQTNLKFGEQKRVFSLITGLENAEFIRYGVMHRNTFINSPKLLNPQFNMRDRENLYFAGQMTGVEGYIESAASGIFAGLSMVRRLQGKPAVTLPDTTMLGALSKYISDPTVEKFQPMGCNMGILPELPERIRDKKLKYKMIAERGLADFDKALERDVKNRARTCREEIAFVQRRRADCAVLMDLLDAGKLPLRVTHNDTKLNNILIDKDTGEGICVIDLDTVMPGLSINDFGDSIRFGANHCAEDEADLSKVNFSMELFEIYTKGFLQAAGEAFTPLEKQTLPWGAKLMTLECGIRFLTDYLQGDTYFKIHRDGQNLDRCRTQFKLVADMEKKWDEMRKIVEEESR